MSYIEDIGTIRPHPRGYSWSPARALEWVDLIGELDRNVKLVVAAEMEKRGDAAPKSVLLSPPQVTRIDTTGVRPKYSVTTAVILNPTKAECAEPGVLLVPLDGPTRDLTLAQLLQGVREKLGKTAPLTEPGPIALT